MSDGSWEVSWGCFHPCLNASQYKILGTTLTIADVLRVLGIHHTATAKVRTNPAYLTVTAQQGKQKTEITFNLAAPLSDPSNAAACEAVLSIITEK